MKNNFVMYSSNAEAMTRRCALLAASPGCAEVRLFRLVLLEALRAQHLALWSPEHTSRHSKDLDNAARRWVSSSRFFNMTITHQCTRALAVARGTRRTSNLLHHRFPRSSLIRL